MTVLPHVLAATKSSGGGSIGFLVVIVIIGIAGYFFFLRPQQQKARKQKAQQQDVGIGDEVMTIGGIVGTILDMENDRVTIIRVSRTATKAAAPGSRPGSC